ncbi:hypothetical protein [Pseudoclavibacter sp. CFCC 11306]|uniref:hypothetical protein n=1 Tax=Pseudoclavibacter sp. CFCC 11306 TaxID=1564493 RepID=UPI001301715B|nr:hypothetical protein [Pseudoclavibacter sp. CFCC 11306]KAB1659015.1 hypothetical protein F8O09_05470 [Pseudoclavibacter sp. CFCC 11306]
MSRRITFKDGSTKEFAEADHSATRDDGTLILLAGDRVIAVDDDNEWQAIQHPDAPNILARLEAVEAQAAMAESVAEAAAARADLAQATAAAAVSR